jgi:hypothetical protein
MKGPPCPSVASSPTPSVHLPCPRWPAAAFYLRFCLLWHIVWHMRPFLGDRLIRLPALCSILGLSGGSLCTGHLLWQVGMWGSILWTAMKEAGLGWKYRAERQSQKPTEDMKRMVQSVRHSRRRPPSARPSPWPFYFSDGVSYFLPALGLGHDPIYISCVAGITGEHHYNWLIHWYRVSWTFCPAWPGTMILPISASQITGSIGVSHSICE